MVHNPIQIHGASTLIPRILIVSVVIVGSLSVGVAVAKGYYFFLILPALLPYIFMALRAQEKMLFPIITAFFLAEYSIWLLGLPVTMIYLIHLLIFTMCGAMSLKKAVARWRGGHINIFVLGWMIYLSILLFVNSSIGVFALQKLAVFFLYPLLFFAVLNVRKGELFDKRVLFFLLFFVALQFPVLIVQKIIYWNVSPDRVGGTLRYAGGTHLIAILMSQFWCFALALLLLSRKRAIAHYALLALPFIPMALGSGNAGFLFAIGSGIIVYGVYLFLLKTEGMLRKVSALVVTVFPFLMTYLLVVVILPKFDPQFIPDSWHVISSVDGMIGHMTGYEEEYRDSTIFTPAYRLEQIKIVASITKNIFLGNGLGSLNDSPLLGLSNDTFSQSYKLVLSWATSFTEFLLEAGAVGVLLYVAAILSFVVKAFVIVRKSKDKFWKVYSLGFIGMAAVLVISSLYADSWKAYPVAGSFWICAAIVERVHRRMRIIGKFPY